MRGFVALPDRNRDDHDYSGAFRPEAERLVRLYPAAPIELVQIDVSLPFRERGAQLAAALREAAAGPAIDYFAFLCHGWRGGIQLGYGRESAPQLAALLAGAAAPGAAVALFACSTAACEPTPDEPGCGGGGFADALYEGLAGCVVREGASGSSLHVDAHDRRGHCTSNPYVWRQGAAGAGWIIPPRSPLWTDWCQALRDRKRSTLRLRYPLMSTLEIEKELRS